MSTALISTQHHWGEGALFTNPVDCYKRDWVMSCATAETLICFVIKILIFSLKENDGNPIIYNLAENAITCHKIMSEKCKSWEKHYLWFSVFSLFIAYRYHQNSHTLSGYLNWTVKWEKQWFILFFTGSIRWRRKSAVISCYSRNTCINV